MHRKAVKKSQKTTYFAWPFCVMLYCIIESRQYRFMDLSARLSPKLIFSQYIVGFCKFGQTRNQDSLNYFCQTDATIGGRVSFRLVSALIDWLYK